MQKQKGLPASATPKTLQAGISTLVGIIIIVVTAVVLFGGVFAWQYLVKPIVLPPQIENTQTNSPAPSEVEGWETYKNDKYGFSMSYPQNFHLQENDFSTNFGIVMCPPSKTQTNPNGLVSCAVRDALKGDYEDGMIYLFTYNDNNIINKEAYKYLGQNPLGGKFYYLYAATNRFPEYSSLIEKILKTFNFIDLTNQTAGWKTYKNFNLGFSIQYPNDLPPTLELSDQKNKMTAFGKANLGRYFEVRVFDNEQYAEGFLMYSNLNFQRNVLVGGVQGYKIIEPSGMGTPFIKFGAEHDGLGYVIIFYGDDKISQEEQQILSTFKFTK